MRSLAESGGLCAFHAARIEAIGQSATVALIYLGLIETASRASRLGGTTGARRSRCSLDRMRAQPARINGMSNAASAFFSRC